MAAAGNDCSDLDNWFYYSWRMLTTLAVFVLSALLYRSAENLKAFKARIGERKKNDEADFTDNDRMLIYEKMAKIRDHSGCCGCCCNDKNAGWLLRNGRIGAVDRFEDNVEVTSNQRSGYDLGSEKEASRTVFVAPVERSEVVFGNDSQHSTKFRSEAVADNYRVAKIVTTVEVTLQPRPFEKVTASLAKEDGGDLVDSGDLVERIDFQRNEIVEAAEGEKPKEPEEPINSILEAAKAHTIEEVLEKVETLEAVADIIREAGLEWSNLIFGIDYTASNKMQGEKSFYGKSLHAIEPGLLNPYQQVISVLGKTLAPFANSGFIAGYGFGDAKTEDTGVFPLKTEKGFCTSFSQMLSVYNEITPKVILSGPTNFAPLIYEAMKICKQVKKYHILVIVADGQVTNEPATREAIFEACQYPLSIIVVGVGDGPWDMMQEFDGSLPKRTWDNFHFVEFQKVTAGAHDPELSFAVQALVEIPDQYKKIKALGLLDNFATTPNGEILK